MSSAFEGSKRILSWLSNRESYFYLASQQQMHYSKISPKNKEGSSRGNRSDVLPQHSSDSFFFFRLIKFAFVKGI